MRHVNTVPCEPQEFTLPHAGVKGRRDDGLQPLITRGQQSLGFGFTREIAQSSIRLLELLDCRQRFPLRFAQQ